MEIKDTKELIRLWKSAAEKRSEALVDMIGNFTKHAEIVLSDEVDSIAITRSEQRSLCRVSNKFIERYCSTPDDVLFLLLHEMAHKFHRDSDDLGFNYLDPDIMSGAAIHIAYETYKSINTRLDHYLLSMVEDIVVNARLCERYFPHAAPFLIKLYDIKTFPDLLLIPPVLLENYRGVAVNFDPLYGSYFTSSDFDHDAMIEPQWGTLINPVLHRAKNWPAKYFEGDSTLFSDPNDGVDAWVTGMSLWYWRAWSLLGKTTLADLYLVLRQNLKELPTMLLLGSHEPRGDIRD